MEDYIKTFARPSVQQLCSFARYGLDLGSTGLEADERSYKQQLTEDEQPIKELLKKLFLDTDVVQYESAATDLDNAIESNRSAYFGLCKVNMKN